VKYKITIFTRSALSSWTDQLISIQEGESIRVDFKIWKLSAEHIRKYLEQTILKNYSILPGVLTALLSMGFWQIGAWRPLEFIGFNLLFNTRNYLPHRSWDSRIAVIGIDDVTLRQYGQFPLSRNRYTQLLETLQSSQPAAIGFDILFTEPSVEDAKLAEAMAMSGQVVLAIAPSPQKYMLRPVQSLENVTTQGHIVSNADIDGITRQVSLYDDQIPAFSIKLLQAYNTSLEQTVNSDNKHAKSSPISIPALQSGVTNQSVWINWVEPTLGKQKIATYSFINVIQGKVDKTKLRDKILLVGLTATGTNDTLKTPFEQVPPTSGIYLHAAVIDNLLNHRLLGRLPQQLDLLLICGFAIGSSLVLAPLSFYQRMLLLGILPFIWFAIAVAILNTCDFWLPIAAPVGTIFLSGLTVQWREHREKQQLMSLFASHVSPETAELIWRNRQQILQNGQLEAKEMIATVIFTDIRSFTSISEKMTPRDLLHWLNTYLGTMAECIQKHHGVIDKYIGDAIMAVFGIPLPHTQAEEIEQDAINAVTAAIAMQERLARLNQDLQQQGLPKITVGIGIHTGLLVAGSIGGSQRLNYPVLGDAVNIAARLEQLNKNTSLDNPYGILVSKATFQLIKKQFKTRKADQMQLRGREQLTMVYAIIGYADIKADS